MMFLDAQTTTNGTSLLSGMLFGGGIITLVLQTITLIGLIWKGGRWSQWMESRHEQLEMEHKRHMDLESRDRRDDLVVIERIVGQLEKLEDRVGRLEGRK